MTTLETLSSKLDILPAHMLGAFACMGVAEEEIEGAKKRNKRKAALINTAFRWCCPGDLLRGKTEFLYRKHVQELIERVKLGLDPVPLTDAEVLAAVLATSLKAPLNQRYAALATELFLRLKLGQTELVSEPWKGANEELLRELANSNQLPNPRRGIR